MQSIDIVVWPIIGAAGALTLDGGTLMPVGAALGVMGAVWILSRRVKGWEDRLEAQDKAQAQQAEAIAKLTRLMESRPCVKPADICPEFKSN